MKKSTALLTAVAGAALCCAAAWAAPQKPGPEDVLLPPSAYRVPLQEIIVHGRQRPYWYQAAPPRWNAPKIPLPKMTEEKPPRLQWIPRYTRDERVEYNHVRQQLEPKPLFKLFEIHF